jgi:hypothetical protein
MACGLIQKLPGRRFAAAFRASFPPDEDCAAAGLVREGQRMCERLMVGGSFYPQQGRQSTQNTRGTPAAAQQAQKGLSR